MKYFLIGPYPPPYGGISVFIQRLTKNLINEGFTVKQIDFGKLSQFNKVLILFHLFFYPKMAVYHLNGFNFLIIVVLLIKPFKCKIIYHDHNARAFEEISIFKKFIFKLFLKKVDRCILISQFVADYYTKNEIKLPINTEIKNAYLPPPIEEAETYLKSYPADIHHFLDNHQPVIIANAYQLILFHEIDLYGLDMCLDLTVRLKKIYPEIGFLFALAETGNQAYNDLMVNRLNQFGLENNFMILMNRRELWPLFKKADLMVRPTFNDGYGISIAEALALNCPAVASDICDRPKGTILFKNRDFDDFYAKCLMVLKNKGKT